MIKTVGIISRPRREDIERVVPPLVNWLQAHGVEVTCDSETSDCFGPLAVQTRKREDLPGCTDLLTVLGGDGTLLSAARLAANRAERGNLYALLRNTPLDSLDSLGLCDSKCGKDVTLVVRQTLADIAATFIAAPWYNQDRADISMFGWTPLALGSWDIRSLRYYNYTAPDSEECNGTVTFEGRCVAADELNYMMFGLGIKLCGEDLDTELGALRLALWIRSLGRDLDITQRKVGFAKYGAGGYSTMPGWLTWPHPCSPDKERLPEDVHDWRWSGLKGGPY